ncbi:hypothetical protein N7499_000630 [Penicillium canescens]|uniref:Uncharacterized protein n=1 Tax=Penicillium canescens TaxID=5083 RepID=A0AAD6NBF7_PENCN|nr:uncharacterized protein N7446_011170 [Penicillium canescens]KAJ6029482.1 hypothetical protein N7444_012469 [Penicillium canescens]KAJ6047914.1 hypothetical protein N7460_004061 [Penicillium canescens]KAJ6048487.1 hypothetical protein N7446_011170 [Penicillium canescens]KAJ6101000.1 hypothetical protein N7499_000630 [Penicillium canescens]KAJ6173457.1 hypothetical protein N7485_006269 [Penicillium canescens]
MKSAFIVLATILPLAMTAATPESPDLGFIKKEQELGQGQGRRCELTTFKQIRQVPCPGASQFTRGPGEKFSIICSFPIGLTTWFKTENREWLRNLNGASGEPGPLPKCDI